MEKQRAQGRSIKIDQGKTQSIADIAAGMDIYVPVKRVTILLIVQCSQANQSITVHISGVIEWASAGIRPQFVGYTDHDCHAIVLAVHESDDGGV